MSSVEDETETLPHFTGTDVVSKKKFHDFLSFFFFFLISIMISPPQGTEVPLNPESSNRVESYITFHGIKIFTFTDQDKVKSTTCCILNSLLVERSLIRLMPTLLVVT